MMKKVLICLTVLVALVSMAACDTIMQGIDYAELEGYYEQVAEATKITQKTEIKDGEFVVFKRETLITKGEDGYDAIITEWRRKDLSSEDEEDPENKGYVKTERKEKYVLKDFEPSLVFGKNYFENATFSGGIFKATVPLDKAANFLSISALETPTSPISIEMDAKNAKISELVTSYEAGVYAVKTVMSFEYESQQTNENGSPANR